MFKRQREVAAGCTWALRGEGGCILRVGVEERVNGEGGAWVFC